MHKKRFTQRHKGKNRSHKEINHLLLCAFVDSFAPLCETVFVFLACLIGNSRTRSNQDRAFRSGRLVLDPWRSAKRFFGIRRHKSEREEIATSYLCRVLSYEPANAFPLKPSP